MGDSENKNYLSIREAAEKMGYTRQYVYRALSNRFKDYLKVIDGEKKLHVSVLKLVDCNHVNKGDNLDGDIDVNMFTNIGDYDIKKNSDIARSNYENNVDKHYNYNGYSIDLQNQSIENAYNQTIAILKEQLLSKDKQLLEKDNQILQKDSQIKSLQDELNLQNEHVRKQSDRLVSLVEQVNELQRNNQVLLAQKDINNTKEIDEKKENKGLFSWLFKNK